MISKIFYIADDGKMFDTIEACLSYENKINRKLVAHYDVDSFGHINLFQAKDGTEYIQVIESNGKEIFDGTFERFHMIWGGNQK